MLRQVDVVVVVVVAAVDDVDASVSHSTIKLGGDFYGFISGCILPPSFLSGPLLSPFFGTETKPETFFPIQHFCPVLADFLVQRWNKPGVFEARALACALA